MAKFVGVQNNEIKIISDHEISHSNMEIIELSEELQQLSSHQLITNFKLRNGNICSKFSKKPIEKIKLALVGNWKMKCGIATYAENLWSEIIDYTGDFKMFIEKHDSYVGPLNIVGGKEIPADKVVPCWQRGQSLQQLISEIKAYDPDVIWIQHEFGLWPNAGYWLAMMTQLSEYRIVVTMHSIFHHKDKTICEAAMPEIVSHLDGGYDVLKKEKQIPGKVHVIPHGCFPCTNKEKLWNFYHSNYTFMQFGFGFRYKGWENSIRATAILKEKYFQVFFTGLFSESDYNAAEHKLYYDELISLTNKLGVQENIALLRGFQSDATLDAYMRTNQATLFPYISHPAHEVYGASGAARIAMSKAVPVITSSVNHFSDLPTIKADTPEEIAAALEKLFLSSDEQKKQIDKQIAYINENTWEKVAFKYINLFENPELIIGK